MAASPRAPLPALVREAWALLRPPQRRMAGAVFAVALGSAFVELVGVGSVFPFLRVLTDPTFVTEHPWARWAYERGGFRSPADFQMAAGAAVLLLTVLANVAAYASAWMQARFVAHLNDDFSRRLLATYLGRPWPFFLRSNTSDLQKRVLEDSSRVVYGIFAPTLVLVTKCIVGVAILALLMLLDPLATAMLAVLFGVAYATLYARLRHRLLALGEDSVTANEQRFRVAAEAFGGVKEVKAFGTEELQAARFAGPSRAYADTGARYTALAQVPRFLMQTLVGVAMMGLLLAKLAAGQPVAEVVPIIGVFAFAGYRMMPAFQDVLQALTSFRYNQALFRTLAGDLRGDAPPPGPAPGPLPLRTEVRVSGLRFRYPDAADEVLRGIDVVIPRGTAVAFVGETGAGKSTLVDLLLGLLEPASGTIAVDGAPLTPATAAAWRRNVGYIPQEIYLRDDTIARNIAVAEAGEPDLARMERAARVAQLHDFVAALPQGYHTVVGERGVRLSGGQRQRIGIARALYHDPEVLLLDEATSDIDNVTQASLARALEALAGHKTLVVVAHRLETVRRCDRIYVLHQGEVAAEGTYEGLLAASPRFRALAAQAPPVAPLP